MLDFLSTFQPKLFASHPLLLDFHPKDALPIPFQVDPNFQFCIVPKIQRLPPKDHLMHNFILFVVGYRCITLFFLLLDILVHSCFITKWFLPFRVMITYEFRINHNPYFAFIRTSGPHRFAKLSSIHDLFD